MINVVGASIAYKIVKKDYIALQCKSLIIKIIIHCIKVAINGDGINAIVLRNRRTAGTMSQGSGDHIAYGVPHSPAGLQSKIVNKVLDKLTKV